MATVDKSDTRVREMFGQIAPNYDRMNHWLSLNVDRYWRWRTVRKLRPNRSEPILDVCAGTGCAECSSRRQSGRLPQGGRH
jgi:demethylmenaquinone methyltransferase/2-methoxy-6-polyprenyl-1,4-benzoquinol methylase